MSTHTESLKVFESLAAGDRVELDHEVKVGSQVWHTTSTLR